jgi:hypothetical protein
MRTRCLPFALLLLHAVACDSKDAAKPADAAPAKADASPAKAEAKAEAPPPPAKFGAEFCETIIPCFEKHEFSGSFSADVSVDIEPDGSVAAVSFTGDAPKPVQTCIVDGIKPITLSDYNGKPGRTRCTQNGQLSGGTRMIMADYTYEVREAGAAPEAEAEPEGKAGAPPDAKADAKSP